MPVIYDQLYDRGVYAVAHGEPVYVTQDEADQLLAAFGDSKSVRGSFEVDPDRAAEQQAAADA